MLLERPAANYGGQYFPLVDVLRGLAALAVLTLHVIHHASWTSFPTTGVVSWLRNGDEGVDLFFVISGFVVLLNALKLRDTYPGSLIPRAAFCLRRLARIVPVYYLTLAFWLIFIEHRLFAVDFSNHILSHLFFYHTYSWTTFSSINGVNWTIAIEMQFYILILFFAPLIARTRALRLVAVSILIAWAWRYYAFSLMADEPKNELWNYLFFVKSSQIPGMLDEFAIGMAIALLIRRGYLAQLLQSILFVPAMLAAFATFIYLADSHAIYLVGGREMADHMTRKTLLGLAYGSLVLCVCAIKSPILITWSFPLRYLGTISYGVYLWHLPVIMLLKGRIADPLYFYVATLVLAVSVASLSWHFLEKPIIDMARRFEPKLNSISRPSTLGRQVTIVE